MSRGPVRVRVARHGALRAREAQTDGTVVRQVHEHGLSGNHQLVHGATHGSAKHAHCVRDVGPRLASTVRSGLVRSACSTSLRSDSEAGKRASFVEGQRDAVWQIGGYKVDGGRVGAEVYVKEIRRWRVSGG
eukprot:6213643-Pleurochrysis_carterae.AAC.4